MRGFLILLGAVLCAIAIGVGLVSTSSPSSHGPANAPFTAAFGGPVMLVHPTQTVPQHPAKAVAGSGILAYLQPSKRQSVDAYSYRSSWHNHQLTVSLIVNKAFVPKPSQVGSQALPGGYRTDVSYAMDTTPRRPLVARPVMINHRAADLGVSCLPAVPRHPAGLCVAVLSGLRTATRTSITTWSAVAWAPTAGGARSLVASLRPLDG